MILLLLLKLSTCIARKLLLIVDVRYFKSLTQLQFMLVTHQHMHPYMYKCIYIHVKSIYHIYCHEMTFDTEVH